MFYLRHLDGTIGRYGLRLVKTDSHPHPSELVTEGMKTGLQDLLAAIKHLHSLGLVHNDINPANIMLDQEGTLILIDFDSCRNIGESLRSTET